MFNNSGDSIRLKGEGSETVQRAFGLLEREGRNGLQVNHGCLDIAMPEEPLDGLEVVPREEQMACEGVAKRVR